MQRRNLTLTLFPIFWGFYNKTSKNCMNIETAVLSTKNLLANNLWVIFVPFQLELAVVGLSQDSEGLQVGVGKLCHRIKVLGRQSSDWANFLK
jgi:hypothetical protein